MPRRTTGEYVPISTLGVEAVRAFVPHPLPPDPPLAPSAATQAELERALLALGRLDGVATLLPDTQIFLYAYVRKEAVLSSQIEGTQSSLSDLLLFELAEAPGVPFDDVQEVSSYVAALEHGIARVRGGFPLSERLLREMHAILLAKGRGASKQPGEYRRSQNWIGGPRPSLAHFVPPPPERLAGCMAALERFLHDDPVPTPVLVKAALSHVQFETIHPFLDGNGRLGRLLVTLLLCVEGVLREPLLYLSLFFKSNRSEYYQRLDGVRRDGDFEGWLDFFTRGVRETSESAVATARGLVELFETDRGRIRSALSASGSVLQVHDALQRRPLHTIPGLAAMTGLSAPTVAKALEALGGAALGIVREVTGKRRNRVFAYDRYLAILSEGTEPLR